MNSRNRTLRVLRAGGSDCCVWLALGSVAMAEMAHDAGATSIVFDLQHGLWERSSLEAAIGLVGNSATPLVRVGENSEHAICSALDAGAHGILIPMVGSAAAAAVGIAAAHYPPRGIRSGGGVRPLRDFAAYRRFASTEILVSVMIETVEAAENAAAVAAVPGVDLVFIGSGDLSVSLEASGRRDVTFDSLINRIRQAAERHAVPCGIFASNAAEARARIAQGFRFAVAESDLALVRNGFANALRIVSGEAEERP